MYKNSVGGNRVHKAKRDFRSSSQLLMFYRIRQQGSGNRVLAKFMINLSDSDTNMKFSMM